MGLITLALLAATVAALHRMATVAQSSARALVPQLEDPLTVALARLGFHAENHRVVELSSDASTILPHRFIGEVDGYMVTVSRRRSVGGIDIEVAARVAWPSTAIVLDEDTSSDEPLAAALLGGGLAQHVVHGATVHFDGAVLRLVVPATEPFGGQTAHAVRALVRAAARLEFGRETLDEWLLAVATSDQSSYARRNAMVALLTTSTNDEVKERAAQSGLCDEDLGVRLAVAAHVGDDILGFLDYLAGAVDEPRKVRRDALEELVLSASTQRARSVVTRELSREDERRGDALAVLTELIAESDEHAHRTFEVLDDLPTLRLARPVLWAIIVVAEEELAVEAIERLGDVGIGSDLHDLRRIDANPALLVVAETAQRRIRERIGVHALSIVDSSVGGKLSVVR